MDSTFSQASRYWFTPSSKANKYNVYDLTDRVCICEYDETKEINKSIELKSNVSQSPIDLFKLEKDFSVYKNNLEYIVGKKVDIDNISMSNLANKYEDLIVGIIRIRAFKAGFNPDQVSDSEARVINYIRNTDFFTAPASAQFHESYVGGLVNHHVSVYNQIPELLKIDKFSNVEVDSAALCCLVHDWCKIGLYKPYERNVKNEVTGKWEKKPAYKYADVETPMGHGAASMFMAMKFFRLTDEEALAIRWHMGRWNVSDTEKNELSLSNRKYPLVHFVQFADQLATVYY